MTTTTTKPSTNGLAGFKTLKYAYRESFVSIGNESEQEIGSSDIVFASGRDWADFYFTPGTLFVDEKEKKTDAGKTLDNSIKFSFPGDSSAMTYLLNTMCNKYFVLLIEDMNGNNLLFGNTDTPLKMRYEKKKESKPSGAKHYEIEFYGTTLNTAIYVV